ncbi:MAG: Tol-Pal system beta propeller repeat protein TolB [Calditrichaceae bacterium]
MTEISAQNEVRLKVQKEGFDPIVLFISEFGSENGNSFREILINDLNLSGFFIVVDLVNPTDSLKISNSSARAGLSGSLEIKKDNLKFSSRLVELPGTRQIFDKKFEADLSDARLLAHKVADEIVYYLVGEKGIANSKIVFTVAKGQAKEIAIIDFDGHGVSQLTHNNSLNLSPAWSPDGKQIAYTSYMSGRPELLIQNIGDGKLYRMSKLQGLYSAPAWSPDGKKIALTITQNGNAEIYSLDVKDGSLRRLTNHPAIDSSPTWAPNGREIAFTSDRSGNPQIYLMDAMGGNVRRLTFEGKYNDSACWSPRGDFIAFVSREDGGFQIYTIDINGSQLRRITVGSGNHENPVWSPDGLKLAFAMGSGMRWDIYMVNWDGSNMRAVTSGGNNASPRWSPRLNYD